MKQFWRRSKLVFDTSILGFSVALFIVIGVVRLIERLV